jgi:NAD(P)-dependent dehydrogenase (short-subunit alcohol dehydrogenase family)
MTYQPPAVHVSGRVAVVTGANSGMGNETARELARMGAEVVLACRSTERGQAARDDIVTSTGARSVSVMQLDLSSLRSVRAFAGAFTDRFPALDVLVNNAAASLSERQLTDEGFERHWATNVLGPHLLTTLLLPSLRTGGRGRVVDVSTRAAGGLDLSDTQFERRGFSGGRRLSGVQAGESHAGVGARRAARGRIRHRQRAEPGLRAHCAGNLRPTAMPASLRRRGRLATSPPTPALRGTGA